MSVARLRTARQVVWVLGLAVSLSASACADGGPYFISVLGPRDTVDTVGPYVVDAWVGSGVGVDRVILRITDDPLEESGSDLLFGDVAMPLGEGDAEEGHFIASLPGRPAGTLLRVYVVAVDRANAATVFPPTAPAELLQFAVRGP